MQYRFADLGDLPGFEQAMQSWSSIAGVPTALLDTERHVRIPSHGGVGGRGL